MTGDAPDILWRDDFFVAVHKPAGLLVHRSPLDPREERFALQLVRNRLGRHVYPCHRLDRATSGILLFGLTSEAAGAMGGLLISREVQKGYLAVVRGILPQAGVIDHPLADEPEPGEVPGQGAPRSAVTSFRCLATVELPIPVGRYPAARYSLAAAWPHTGRRRQIRRHFKHLLHPIVGDTTYGEGRHNRLFRDHFGCSRLLLHAARLSFRHPFTGEEIVVTARPDGIYEEILHHFGWEEGAVELLAGRVAPETGILIPA